MRTEVANLLQQYDPSAKEKGRYWLATCPKCQKNTLYIYKNSLVAICSRLNKCQFKDKVENLPGVNKESLNRDYFKNLKRHRSKKKKVVTANVHREILVSLGRRNKDVIKYLQDRLPLMDVEKEIFDKKIAGISRRMGRLKDNNPLWLDKKGYKLLTPLYNIRTDRIVSAQTRYSFFNSKPTLVSDDGPIKTRSLKNCPYGEDGATFGSLKKALEIADKEASAIGQLPIIIITEGDIDYLTLRGCGYDNAIGVPGAGQAKNVARYLQDIEWRGILILSMDGDNAGEASVNAVGNLIENENIILMNARPLDCDINDVYNQWGGQEAIQRLIQYSRPIKNRNRSIKAIHDDRDMVRLLRMNLWVKPVSMPTIVRDRYRVVIRGSGTKSPLKPIARAVNCREVKEMEIFYKDGHLPMQAGVKTRVAETPTCLHCVAVQWNLCVAKYLLKHWPTHLKYITMPFKEGDLEDALKKKKEICDITRVPSHLANLKGSKFFGQSLFVMIDLIRSELIIVTGTKNKNDIVLASLRSLGKVRSIKREVLMRDILLPAYLSYSQYIIDKGEDFEHVLVKDPILTQQFKRYSCREELPWPKQKEVREEVRRIRREQAEKLKEEIIDENGYSIFVTFRERAGIFKKLLGMSWKSLSFDNITRADIFGQPMNFDPKDPQAGNFLENPHLAPKPVKDLVNDFFWLQYGHPAFVNKDHNLPEYTAKQTVVSASTKKVELPSSDYEYKEMLIKWNNMGYNPTKHEFLPGEVPVSKLFEEEEPPL